MYATPAELFDRRVTMTFVRRVQSERLNLVGFVLVVAPAACRAPSPTLRGGDGRLVDVAPAGSLQDAVARRAPAVPPPPGVHPGMPTVAGPLSNDEVVHVVERSLAPVGQCYEQAHARDPGATGRVVMHFVIDTNGTVSRSDITEAPAALVATADCISRAIVSWRFPARESHESVSVTYPIDLRTP